MTLTKNTLIENIAKPISQLALGTAWFRNDALQPQFEMMDEFVALGGTVLDTGRKYGDSENVIGQWMQARANRDKVVVITKGGHGTGCGITPAENLAETIDDEISTSLRHLRTDYIDLYFLHRDSPSVPIAEIMDCLNKYVDSGQVRAIGASNWEYSRIREANIYTAAKGITGFSAVSNTISLTMPCSPFYPGLVATDAEGERWHCETRIPLIPWSAMARGFLSGRFTPQMRPNANRIDSDYDTRVMQVYGTDENFQRLHRAAELGQTRGGYSTIQIATAWLLHKPFPIVPIVGSRTLDELRSCIEAAAIKLTDHEYEWLNLVG